MVRMESIGFGIGRPGLAGLLPPVLGLAQQPVGIRILRMRRQIGLQQSAGMSVLLFGLRLPREG